MDAAQQRRLPRAAMMRARRSNIVRQLPTPGRDALSLGVLD
jgi:hypothetical protein